MPALMRFVAGVAAMREVLPAENAPAMGAGTPSHLSGKLFKLALKLDLTAVPFHGGGSMIQSVVA